MTITRYPNGINDVIASDPFAYFGQPDPRKYAVFHDDFLDVAFGSYPADSDGVALKYANTLDTELDYDVSFGGATGALILTTEGGDTEGGQWRVNATPFQITSGKKAWFDCRVTLTAGAGTIGQESFFIGLSDNVTSTNFIADAGTSLAVDEAWGFLSLDAEAGIDFVVRDNDSESSETNVATFVSGTAVRLSIYYDGTESHIYVDGVKVATESGTHPTSDPMTLMLHFKSQEAAVKTCTLDYWTVALER